MQINVLLLYTKRAKLPITVNVDFSYTGNFCRCSMMVITGAHIAIYLMQLSIALTCWYLMRVARMCPMSLPAKSSGDAYRMVASGVRRPSKQSSYKSADCL